MQLADRFAKGDLVYTAWSSLPEQMTIEALADTAFDTITLDAQHGGHSEDSILRCLLSITSRGKPGIVRIPVARNDMASKALDFGAEAVIAPMINDAADARAFAQAMKYPPVGERSWGPTIGLPRTGATAAGTLANGNRATLAFAMIETRRAYERLDEILAVEGIDGIFVGPADFSIAWTGGKRLDPMLEDMMEAIADIASRSRAAGKVCGIYLVDVGYAGRYARMGYQLQAIGAESRLMSEGAKALLGAANASL